MHNLRDMARMLLNGESRLLILCAVNGLGVAEKSLVTTWTRERVTTFNECDGGPESRPGIFPWLCRDVVARYHSFPTVRAY